MSLASYQTAPPRDETIATKYHPTSFLNRKEIIKEQKNELFKKILRKVDFFSTSGVRDLLFHVQEHCFTLPKLSEIMFNFNLEFLGFSDLEIKKKYSKLYPKDKKNILLDNWHKFEIDNTDTFLGMYNFWVRKKL